MTLSAPSMPSAATTSPLPMTSAAWSALLAEVERGDRAASGGLDPDLRRRHETITEVLRHAVIAAEPGIAAIGRRVTFRESDGGRMTVALVIPGDGDPRHGWIGVDAPLGAALLGARAGARVTVHAPAGDRTILVEAVH